MVFLPLVLGLIYLSLRFGLGHYQRFYPRARIRILEQVNLGPKRSLYVVQVGEQHFLLGAGEGGINLLKELESYPEVATEEGKKPSPFFEKIFSRREGQAFFPFKKEGPR